MSFAAASLALRNCLAIFMVMGSGAFCGLFISHALFHSPSETALSNFILSVRALLSSWTAHVTIVDKRFRSEIASNVLLPVHFAIVLDRRSRQRGSLSPQDLLSPAQQCVRHSDSHSPRCLPTNTSAQRLNACTRAHQSIEAALRVADVATIWIASGTPEHHRAGGRLPPSVLAAWAAWRKSLQAHSGGTGGSSSGGGSSGGGSSGGGSSGGGRGGRKGGVELGALSVRAHRFHPTSSVGVWLRERGAAPAFNATDWSARGWPNYPEIVSDLIRLDVLEGESSSGIASCVPCPTAPPNRPPSNRPTTPLSHHACPITPSPHHPTSPLHPISLSGADGGVYLDTDVITLSADLLKLPDGFALQLSPSRQRTWPLLADSL